MKKITHNGMKKITYSTKDYDFNSLIKEWLQVDDLTTLHKLSDYKEIFSREKDQSSEWHQTFYNKIRNDSSFFDLYERFLADVIKPTHEEGIVYQKIPTFRVHLSGNIAVGEWHKDKAYREDGWSDLVKEINYYLPFTDTNDENTIWVESEEDKGDFSPMILKYGECMKWDGVNLMHGNKVNSSDKTRVSVDFRVIDKKNYVPSEHGSINMKIPFSIGGYYKEM